MAVRRKAAAGSETTVPVFFPAGICSKGVIAAAYRGVDPDNPIDAQTSAANTASTWSGRSRGSDEMLELIVNAIERGRLDRPRRGLILRSGFRGVFDIAGRGGPDSRLSTGSGWKALHVQRFSRAGVGGGGRGGGGAAVAASP